ncbi:hypothetical protein GCM10009772_23250 [Pseudonocardia alni subsp. carboxydivorans]
MIRAGCGPAMIEFAAVMTSSPTMISGREAVSTSQNIGKVQTTPIAAPKAKVALRPNRSPASPDTSIIRIQATLTPMRVHSMVVVGIPRVTVP